MNKHYLMSKMKSTGTAYICWFFLGCHYAYLGKWGLQILYWITLGGIGIWALVDLFRIPSMVDSHNLIIANQINEIERKEKAEEKREKEETHARNMAMLQAVSNQNKIEEK